MVLKFIKDFIYLHIIIAPGMMDEKWLLGVKSVPH